VSPVKYELGFYIPEDDILRTPIKASQVPFWPTQILQILDVGSNRGRRGGKPVPSRLSYGMASDGIHMHVQYPVDWKEFREFHTGRLTLWS
jgi:hypothetical protein